MGVRWGKASETQRPVRVAHNRSQRVDTLTTKPQRPRHLVSTAGQDVRPAPMALTRNVAFARREPHRQLQGGDADWLTKSDSLSPSDRYNSAAD